MTERRYYSIRTGRNPRSKNLDLQTMLDLFLNIYSDFHHRGFFNEADDRIYREMPRKLRKSYLWPIEGEATRYSEEDLFDVIEFLYDYVSEPFWTGDYPEYESREARIAYRDEFNRILADYGSGYELSEDGEILSLGAKEMRPLLEQELPEYDPENVGSRVEAAVLKFRHHTPTLEDKQEAVSQLANVLEFLRPKLKGVLPSKDEGDIFNIANNFGIRHHRPDQKTEYDQAIWLDWIFYCYLNTIHIAIRLLARAGVSPD